MSHRGACAALLCVMFLGPRGVAHGPPSIKDVMRRVGAYVDSYGERAGIVVATERYTQETKGNTRAEHRERKIVSEFAIVKVDAVTGWVGFRDVIEVDGRPLPDREDRLVRSLKQGGGGYVEARRLSDESARFNIGIIQRNFNVPTTTLFFFKSENADRFKFSAKNVEKDGTWVIDWRETYHPTLIRTPDGASIPAEGTLWVDPTDGTILRTLLKTSLHPGNSRVQRGNGRVDVEYRFVEALGMWLPSMMDEEWQADAPGNVWEHVQGHAVYSNYRQFTTSVRIK